MVIHSLIHLFVICMMPYQLTPVFSRRWVICFFLRWLTEVSLCNPNGLQAIEEMPITQMVSVNLVSETLRNCGYNILTDVLVEVSV